MAKSLRKRATRDQLVDHLVALSQREIKLFFKRNRLPINHVHKDDFRASLTAALKSGQITQNSIISFLDEITPWGKQHVYLYKGPENHDWRKPKWVASHLTANGIDKYIDANSKLLVLPENIELAKVNVTSKHLRITAIRKREGWARQPEFDRFAKKDGRPMELRAFVNQVFRGIIAFDWNLFTNEAFLQITQLPANSSYEAAAAEFIGLTKPWLDITSFSKLDIRKIIKNLDDEIESNRTNVEAHATAYKRMSNRSWTARSDSSRVPLKGDVKLDGFIKNMRSGSIPRIGDYYWPFTSTTNGNRSERIHVIAVADDQRINFATPSSEEGVRHVLSGLRKHS